jgi:hypothetical protein
MSYAKVGAIKKPYYNTRNSFYASESAIVENIIISIFSFKSQKCRCANVK